MLVAHYDLGCSPASYDFVSFLLGAEMRRQDTGDESIQVRIVPGPRGGFRADKFPPQDVTTRRAMLDRIVIPMTELLPACAGRVAEGVGRGGGGYGLGQKAYGLATLLRAARANCYPLRAPAPPAGETVTITLRECSYYPTRNANLPEWIKVARWLEGQGFPVVFIRDTEKAHEPLEDFTTSPRASTDVLYRASLYASSRLNLFTNNGPAWLCLFMAAPTAIFKMLAPGCRGSAPDVWHSYGLQPGSAWPNLQPRQHVSWDDDTADKIIPVVEQILLVDEMLQCA